MKRSELRQLIKEELLKESKYNYKLVNQVAKECEWKYSAVTEFVRDLLTDINFHTASKKVYDFMNKLKL